MARNRKKRVEEHENHERWLVSYADFITLLFAFFVVMYAISSVNEGKYRVLSDTMVDAFSENLKEDEDQKAPMISDQVLEGEFVERAEAPKEQSPADAATDDQKDNAQQLDSDIETQDNRLWVVASNLDSSLQGYIDQDLVKVNLQGDKIEVQLSNEMLFPSGSARLSEEARKAFRDVALIVRPLKNEIFVEGHTDNVPISTLAFPSNWELSSSRAAAVVNYLARQGVEPERMAAIGFGEHRPIASNDDAAGRSQNRRVSLIIRSSQGGNPYGDLKDKPKQNQRDLPWAESPGGG
jgi:chemotaxis protein MotB